MQQHKLRIPYTLLTSVLSSGLVVLERFDKWLDRAHTGCRAWLAPRIQHTDQAITKLERLLPSTFGHLRTIRWTRLYRLLEIKRPHLSLRTIFFTAQAVFFTLLLAAALTINQRVAPALAAAPSTARTPAATTMTSNAPNVPQPGSLKVGLFTDSPNIHTDEKLLGAKVNIMAWFVHWNNSLASQKLQYACNNGYVPEITWESWDGQSAYNANPQNRYALNDIAQGKYDSLITNSLRAVKNVCQNQTVIVRFDHEMDTRPGVVGWYPWQGNPSMYIAAWQHVVSLGRTVDPNIKWLWSPNRGTATAMQYYPGNQWVNYVGLTLNRGSLEANIQSFSQFYLQNQSVIESFGKPVVISETTDAESLGKKPAWVVDMFNFVESDPNIVGLVWFNGTPNYAFNSSAATLHAFQTSMQQLKKGG